MLKAFCFALLALCALPVKLLAQERYLASYAGFGGFQAPVWAAKDFGFFTKYGLNIDLVMIPGSTRGTLRRCWGIALSLGRLMAPR